MTTKRHSAAIHIVLWIVQIILAASLMFGGTVKLFQPIAKLSFMWPWTGQVPVALVKLTGIADLLGALGLILPALLRIKPLLTPITASCAFALMICASVFHIMRGESSQIGVNIIFGTMAFFIAWGRFKKAPIGQA